MRPLTVFKVTHFAFKTTIAFMGDNIWHPWLITCLGHTRVSLLTKGVCPKGREINSVFNKLCIEIYKYQVILQLQKRHIKKRKNWNRFKLAGYHSDIFIHLISLLHELFTNFIIGNFAGWPTPLYTPGTCRRKEYQNDCNCVVGYVLNIYIYMLDWGHILNRILEILDKNGDRVACYRTNT